MYDNDLATDNACPSEQEHREFLDEKLSSTRHEQVINHLQKCAKCQATCERLFSEFEEQKYTSINNSETLNQVSRIVDLVRRRTPTHDLENSKQNQQISIETSDLNQLQLEYSLIRELGRGGQGLVYLANDIALARSVVIKLLSPRLQTSQDSIERFKREARSVASLQSKYIVPIFRVGSLPSGRLYMVMEYVEGLTLRQLHQGSKSLSFQEIASLVQQVAKGLADAHSNRLVHRDIKPENILIQSRDSVARIVDFGLAFDVEDEARITVEGAIAGTPAYMSPEQVSDPNSVDSSTDIYSLGVVLYELLTGEVPFRGTARMTLLRVLNEDAIAPTVYNESVPQDLATICLRAMSKDRSNRFQSANQLVEELERFLTGQPIESRPISRLEKFWRQLMRNPTVSSLVGSVILLGIILTTVSIYAAMHLNSLNKRIVHQAEISNRQRDAALATLSDLTVQLQRKFDDPEVFVEEIQQSSLEIALRGLEKMEGLAGQSTEGGLARAIALRRLGQTLFRLDKGDAAIECIEKSEVLLRELLESQAQQKDVVLAFADTVLASEECCEEDDDDMQWGDKLAKAIDHCKILKVQDSEVAAKTCELFTRQAEFQLRQDLLDEAEETLAKGIETVSQFWDAAKLPDDSQLRNALLSNQLCTIDLRRIKGSDYRNLANKTLEQVMALPDSIYFDDVLLDARFSLLESLGMLSANDFVLPEGQWKGVLSAQIQELTLWAEAGSDDYAGCSEVLAVLASYRLDIGLDASARDLLRLRAWLAEKRLGQSAEDRFALLERFDSHSALASIEIDIGSAESRQKSFEYCFGAIQGFNRLAAIDSVGDHEWFSIADALAMLVEINDEAPALRDQFREKLIPELHKIDRWLSDSKATATASPDDIANSRESMKALLRTVQPK
jgi:serine/threonine protein kinase